MTARYDRKPCLRGDTMLGWSVDITIDGAPAALDSARLHLCTDFGRLVYAWPTAVQGSCVTLATVPAEVTAKWPTGILEYDLEVTLAGGRVVTWLHGTQPVHPDRTR